MATGGRGRGPATRVRAPGQAGAVSRAVGPDGSTYVAFALLLRKVLRPSASLCLGSGGPRSRGACGHACLVAVDGRRVLDKRAVWQWRRACDVESVALDAD